MTNDKLAAWQVCHVGSCQRYQKCMYHPCRNRGELVPVSLDADTAGLVARLRWYCDACGGPDDPCSVCQAATAIRTITAERDALAKRVAELEGGFVKFGQHTHNCTLGMRMGRDCTCGYAQFHRATLKGTDHG